MLDIVSSERIEDLAERIARAFRPERIVLFGSYASGRADPGSDVDLLVVMDDEGRPLAKAAEIGAACATDFPVDIVVRSAAEIERRVGLGDWFLRGALAEGRVIYDATR